MAVARNVLKQQKQDLTQARLDALGPVTDQGWSAAARGAALDRLVQMGLPHARDEYWKFTRPEGLTQATP
ncbi:MAG: Fe-S cluster assembly protein SufD, partial [Pseudomonadota bacterium]|nr:Fe-S cluster assembly protein SufD [Pseudomonadota bacterium]